MHEHALSPITLSLPKFSLEWAKSVAVASFCFVGRAFLYSRSRTDKLPQLRLTLPHAITRNNIPEALLTLVLRPCISSTIVPSGSVLPACSMLTFDIP